MNIHYGFDVGMNLLQYQHIRPKKKDMSVFQVT